MTTKTLYHSTKEAPFRLSIVSRKGDFLLPIGEINVFGCPLTTMRKIMMDFTSNVLVAPR